MKKLPLPLTTLALLVLCGLCVYGLGVGQASWFKVAQQRATLAQLKTATAAQSVKIEGLQADLNDLSNGLAAAEEAARYKLGYIKPGEKFVLYVSPGK